LKLKCDEPLSNVAFRSKLRRYNVRTCSAEYDVANLDDKAIHLTNDAVQKVLHSYGAHEAGGSAYSRR